MVKKVKKDEEIHQGGNQSKPAPKSTAKKVEVEKKAEKPKASDPKPSTTKSKADVPNSSKAKAIEPKSSTTTQKNSNEPNPKSTSHSRKEEIKASAPASAPASSGGKGILKLGDKLPKIVLLDHKEVEVDVGSLAGEKGIVIFLYPKVCCVSFFIMEDLLSEVMGVLGSTQWPDFWPRPNRIRPRVLRVFSIAG